MNGTVGSLGSPGAYDDAFEKGEMRLIRKKNSNERFYLNGYFHS